MRDGSEGVMAKIIIGLIIIVFALFGFGSITTFLAPVAKVATVNGEEIPQQEMELAVERNRRMMLARDVPIESINEDELREDVLESLISREILTQAADGYDLYYGDGAIDVEIVSADVFKLDGVFNADQFQRVIGSAGYSALSYREEMRTDKKFEQLLTGIMGSAFLMDAEADRYNELLSQKRDLAYLQIQVGELVQEITISDEDIEDYYNDNNQEFVTSETVSLEYVELKRSDLADDLDIDEEELRLYFESNRGSWSTDESRRLAHILVEVTADVSAEQAAARAADIHERIKIGEDFSALAMEESDDLGSKESGGDLGFSQPGIFFPEFEAVAYDLGLNQVSEPVLTEAGYHIIKVLGIEDAVMPSIEEVRAEVEQAYRLSATEDEFVTLSSRLAELLFESIDLEVPATDLGLEIKTTEHLARDASHPLMSDGKVETAAFSPDVLLDGNNSDLLELSEDHYVGLRVQAHQPSETKSLVQVTEDIRYILQTTRAKETADARAAEIIASMEAGSLAKFVADQYDMEWQLAPATARSDARVDPLILREAFKLPRPAENQESFGIASLPNGDSVVMRVSAVIDAGPDEVSADQLALIRQTFSRQVGQVDFQEFEAAHTEAASIERAN